MMQKYQILKKGYFKTSDYNKFTREILDVKIKDKDIANKSDFSGFINNSD